MTKESPAGIGTATRVTRRGAAGRLRRTAHVASGREDRAGDRARHAPGEPLPAPPRRDDGRRRRPPASRPGRSTASSRFTSCARLPALLRVLREAGLDDAVERRRRHRLRPSRSAAARRCMIAEISDAWLAPANAFLPGRHLVEHGAEREDVGARVGLLALELLGRHVLERPEDRALLRQRSARAPSSASDVRPDCWRRPAPRPSPGRSRAA